MGGSEDGPENRAYRQPADGERQGRAWELA